MSSPDRRDLSGRRFTGEQAAMLCFGIIVVSLGGAAVIAVHWQPTGVAKSLLELCSLDQEMLPGQTCLAYSMIPTAARMMSLLVWVLPALALVSLGIALLRYGVGAEPRADDTLFDRVTD